MANARSKVTSADSGSSCSVRRASAASVANRSAITHDLEAHSRGVDRVGRDAQDIAGRLGDECTVRGENTSEVGDIALDGLHGGARCRVAPERLDQRVDGDDLGPPEHQSRKKCPLASRGESDLSA